MSSTVSSGQSQKQQYDAVASVLRCALWDETSTLSWDVGLEAASPWDVGLEAASARNAGLEPTPPFSFLFFGQLGTVGCLLHPR
eukprot:CAMPEP_0184381756 /NCGR_PEP_ID=MMETSP0007-20130409/5771_1 /TAXON_ID=97485 /ORGANISM="Prymnesium parvum, Strain Texoma1" /LENGTH=83 /DNA_ID=CAMNT_0026727489 /DNA_START=258 /DNA_END=505 /DNA_ORIENTATION=+